MTMAFNLEEQEQIAVLKAFWKDYGRFILIGLVAFCFCLAAYKGYEYYKKQQSILASDEYVLLTGASAKKDLPRVLELTEKMRKDYGKTAYATLASFVAANLAFQVNDSELALKQLTWIEDQGYNDNYQTLARYRMVPILIDKKDGAGLEQANLLLKKKPAPGYEILQLEMTGDWYFAQDKLPQAHKAYLEAWDKYLDKKAKLMGLKEVDSSTKEMAKQNPEAEVKLLKIKIDVLGGF